MMRFFGPKRSILKRSGGPVLKSIAQSLGTVTWTSNVSTTNNIVDYGLTQALGTSTTAQGASTSHSRSITLVQNTLYYYRVRSTAKGVQTVSPLLTFTSAQKEVTQITCGAGSTVPVPAYQVNQVVCQDYTHFRLATPFSWSFTCRAGSAITPGTSLIIMKPTDVNSPDPVPIYQFYYTVDGVGSAPFSYYTPIAIAILSTDTATQVASKSATEISLHPSGGPTSLGAVVSGASGPPGGAGWYGLDPAIQDVDTGFVITFTDGTLPAICRLPEITSTPICVGVGSNASDFFNAGIQFFIPTTATANQVATALKNFLVANGYPDATALNNVVTFSSMHGDSVDPSMDILDGSTGFTASVSSPAVESAYFVLTDPGWGPIYFYFAVDGVSVPPSASYGSYTARVGVSSAEPASAVASDIATIMSGLSLGTSLSSNVLTVTSQLPGAVADVTSTNLASFSFSVLTQGHN